ncbi:J domain-containing protein [Candidatus Dependentiae bacterium]
MIRKYINLSKTSEKSQEKYKAWIQDLPKKDQVIFILLKDLSSLLGCVASIGFAKENSKESFEYLNQKEKYMVINSKFRYFCSQVSFWSKVFDESCYSKDKYGKEKYLARLAFVGLVLGFNVTKINFGIFNKCELKNCRLKYSYYSLLDIPKDASKEDINSAYRKLSRYVHPDKNPEVPPHLMKILNEVKCWLINKECRSFYDKYLDLKTNFKSDDGIIKARVPKLRLNQEIFDEFIKYTTNKTDNEFSELSGLTNSNIEDID